MLRPARFPVSHPAFTIVELLVVIGVLGVLLGLLFPVLGTMRTNARQTAELSAGRQLMAAYTLYANAFNDEVMPGYKIGLPAFDSARRQIAGLTTPVAAGRYPWRLAPFLDYNFRGLYLNEHEDTLEELEQDDYASYVYLVSLYPSLGLNATCVGGHQNQLAFNATALQTFGTFYVRRMSEVRLPDQLLVFVSARGVDLGVDPTVYEGYFEVRSPRFLAADGDQWEEQFGPALSPGEFGFVSPRFADHAVTVTIDGHTDALSTAQLRDKRRWANEATTEDYGLEPQ